MHPIAAVVSVSQRLSSGVLIEVSHINGQPRRCDNGARATRQALQRHCGNPAECKKRQVVVQEGWHDGVPDVIVLTIGVQPGGGAER